MRQKIKDQPDCSSSTEVTSQETPGFSSLKEESTARLYSSVL